MEDKKYTEEKLKNILYNLELHADRAVRVVVFNPEQLKEFGNRDRTYKDLTIKDQKKVDHYIKLKNIYDKIQYKKVRIKIALKYRKEQAMLIK